MTKLDDLLSDLATAARCETPDAEASAKDRIREFFSEASTWIKLDSMSHATDPKDGETVLGWWAPVAATGYRGGMESVTFGAADEDGRSDTWTNAFGESADAPEYWTRVKGPK